MSAQLAAVFLSELDAKIETTTSDLGYLKDLRDLLHKGFEMKKNLEEIKKREPTYENFVLEKSLNKGIDELTTQLETLKHKMELEQAKRELKQAGVEVEVSCSCGLCHVPKKPVPTFSPEQAANPDSVL